MRTLFVTTGRVALLAGAALIVTACSGSEPAANATDNAADNMLLEEPANDASALESAANASDPVPLGNDTETTTDVPETSGGDTGGNSQQGNDVAGM